MSRPKLLLRSLAVLWRRPNACRAWITDLMLLMVFVLSSIIFIAAYHWDTFLARPWLPFVLVLPFFPWATFRITRNEVTFRRWIGIIPVGRREKMPSTGSFDNIESMDTEDAVTMEYSKSVHSVMCLYPSHLADIMNKELTHVLDGGEAARAYVVKDDATDDKSS